MHLHRKLREQNVIRRVARALRGPVIGVTRAPDNAPPQEADKAAPQGADGVAPQISKPVRLEELRERIRANIADSGLKPGSSISETIGGTEVLGRHLETLAMMQEFNIARGNASRTTERFRDELLRYLLDQPARGPVLEVGTYWGGTTCLLAYVGAVTGRHVYGFDIDENNITEAVRSCELFGLGGAATIRLESLADFFQRRATRERADLIFIDSDHGYVVTRAELAVIHSDVVPLPRCIAFHDFNYRVGAHEERFRGDLAVTNPVAVDRAVFDFYRMASSRTPRPIFKRFGAFAGDGTVETRTTCPAQDGAFIEDHGSEGMMALFP